MNGAVSPVRVNVYWPLAVSRDSSRPVASFKLMWPMIAAPVAATPDNVAAAGAGGAIDGAAGLPPPQAAKVSEKRRENTRAMRILMRFHKELRRGRRILELHRSQVRRTATGGRRKRRYGPARECSILARGARSDPAR